MWRRSLMTNLALFTNYVSLNLDSRVQVDAIYKDFCKAFNQADHAILVVRLEEMCFSNHLICWVKSF